MPYYSLHPDISLNFQINRILTYGDKGANFEEVKSIAPKIKDFESWFKEWSSLGEKAEKEKRYMHSFYYYRMAEFFLTDDRKEKEEYYNKCMNTFYSAIGEDKLEKHKIPYEGTYLPAFVLKAPGERGRVLIHGGYDSFIEEFYLVLKDLRDRGFTLIVFEGPGQGKALKSGLKFTYAWEKPVKAVIDYFRQDEVALLGISWGGYLCLRAAAFEPRIKQVVAYDILYDGLDVLTNMMPSPVKQVFRFLIRANAKGTVNGIANRARKKKLIIDWGVSHGMYITGTGTPFDFFKHASFHTLKGITHRITQDVLLLAGEKDHYVPLSHFYRLKKELTNARSLSARVFTEKEGGEQHCQVGNHQLALDEIFNWLNTKLSRQ